MKVSKQKMKKFAKKIFRNADLVYELGLMNKEALNKWTFVEFPDEIQEAWLSVNTEERKLFFKRLRNEVSVCVAEELMKKKNINYHTIAKYSYVIDDKELRKLMNDYSDNPNVKKIFIIKEIFSALEEARIVKGEADLENVVKSAKKIYALFFAKTQKKGGKA